MGDVVERLLDLPIAVRAVTVIDINGDYNVYVNCNLDQWMQEAAYKHELKHIKKDHFYNNDPVVINEKEASK
jgi:hypothetical protein